MSNVNLKATWLLELETADARLVLRALGGRLKCDEIAPAKELGDRLTRLRASAVRQLAVAMQKNEDNIEETEDPAPAQ